MRLLMNRTDTTGLINSYFSELNILVEFFQGVPPTVDETEIMINADRLSDKLGEVQVQISVDNINSEETEFIPTANGTCTWARVSPVNSPDRIIVIEDLQNLELLDFTLDTTVSNKLLQIIIKIN